MSESEKKEDEDENEMTMMRMKMKINGLKNPGEINGNDRKLQVWPDWLPCDWFIYRYIDHPHPNSSSHHHVYYSNPKGKKFDTKDEVLGYLSTHKSNTKVSKQFRRRKMNKLQQENNNNNVEEKKIGAESNEEMRLSQTSTAWPDWLPNDWYIDRNHDNPAYVSYCSPKWKKFGSKVEVLHYLAAQSKKVFKQTRKRIAKVKGYTPKKLVQQEIILNNEI